MHILDHNETPTDWFYGLMPGKLQSVYFGLYNVGGEIGISYVADVGGAGGTYIYFFNLSLLFCLG
jgi:hypothetical protein